MNKDPFFKMIRTIEKPKQKKVKLEKLLQATKPRSPIEIKDKFINLKSPKKSSILQKRMLKFFTELNKLRIINQILCKTTLNALNIQNKTNLNEKK